MYSFARITSIDSELFDDFMTDAFDHISVNFHFGAGLTDEQKKSVFYTNLNNIAKDHFGWIGSEDGREIGCNAGVVSGDKITVCTGMFRTDALGSMAWTAQRPYYEAHGTFLRANGINTIEAVMLVDSPADVTRKLNFDNEGIAYTDGDVVRTHSDGCVERLTSWTLL